MFASELAAVPPSQDQRRPLLAFHQKPRMQKNVGRKELTASQLPIVQPNKTQSDRLSHPGLSSHPPKELQEHETGKCLRH